jgi:hypothetical protein
MSRKTFARGCALLGACLCVALAHTAFAKPGGEPLVLDTETGIHSGTSGTVLQTAPLNSSGMVQMDTLPQPPQQQQQPIVVSPYVEYPSGGQTATSSGNGRSRSQRQPGSGY